MVPLDSIMQYQMRSWFPCPQPREHHTNRSDLAVLGLGFFRSSHTSAPLPIPFWMRLGQARGRKSFYLLRSVHLVLPLLPKLLELVDQEGFPCAGSNTLLAGVRQISQ